jgi:hypothetical protein
LSEANTRNEVHTFFVALMQKLYPSIPVRRAKTNAPATNELNIVVDFLSERNLGNEVVFLPKSEQYGNAGYQEATINIQAIGEGSLELLDQLKYLVEMPNIVDLCSEANVAINSVEQVQNLTATLDGTTWQERGSVDLIVSYSRELLTSSADWFDKLKISGTTSNGKNKEERPAVDGEIVKIEITGELE